MGGNYGHAAQACTVSGVPRAGHLAIRDLHNGGSQLHPTCTWEARRGRRRGEVASKRREWESMYVALSWHSKTAHDPARELCLGPTSLSPEEAAPDPP